MNNRGGLFVNNSLLIKPKKYFIYVTSVFVILCSLLLIGCAFNKKLSDDELKECSNQLEKSLKTFCDSYNLTDAEIKMDDNYYKDYKNSIYVITVEMKSDQFIKLTGVDAFNLIKESASLRIVPEDNSGTISIAVAMVSGDKRYTYESRKDIEYLKSADISVVTLRNGNVILDEFAK